MQADVYRYMAEHTVKYNDPAEGHTNQPEETNVITIQEKLMLLPDKCLEDRIDKANKEHRPKNFSYYFELDEENSDFLEICGLSGTALTKLKLMTADDAKEKYVKKITKK